MRNLIFGLARPMMRLLGRDERGGVAVIVGVLLGGGVLLGMGAMVIDVGRLYQNRAELQNGADAAALAIARTCALGSCNPGVAPTYANGNASALTGNLAGVDLVCGTGMGTCPGSTTAIYDCPAPPANGANFVDVHTSTRTPSGTLLPPALARALLGNGSYSGTNVKACAQAEWGPPSGANSIAFTISACTWDQATSLGTNFAPPPPYPPNPNPSYDQVLRLHGSPGNTNPQGCATEPAGADGPGNFGWTDDSGNCSVTVSNSTYGGSTGTSVSKDCAQALYNYWVNRTLIFVPVYVTVGGTGTTSIYTLKGFAGFVVTGFRLPGSQYSPASDWLNPKNNCKGNDFCINGFFTQALIPSTGTVGGQNLGANIIQLTG